MGHGTMGGMGKGKHSDFRVIIIKIEIVIAEITLKDPLMTTMGIIILVFLFLSLITSHLIFTIKQTAFSIPLVA